MKCPHCSFERDTAFAYCPKCVKPSTREAEPIVICPTPRILAFIKDDLFLALCVLLTASIGCSMLYGGFNLILLLITIFAWLTYAGGRKNLVEHNHLRCISGSVYANYVINNVAVVIIALCGVLYTIALSIPTILGGLNLEELLNSAFAEEEYGMLSLIPVTLMALLTAVAMVLGFILIAFAILMLIFNLAGVKKLHRFVKSLYVSAETGEENIIGANKLRPWLVVFTVISCLSALTYLSANILAFLSEGCLAAVYIILNILIGKHLIDK